MNSLRRWGTTVVTMVSVATLVLLVTGWGSAAASSMLNVFVTNTSAHPVPVSETNTDANGNIKVHEQGTANVQGIVTSRPSAPTDPFSKLATGEPGTYVLAGPSSTPINLTSLTTSADESNYEVDLRSKDVPGTATDCSGNFTTVAIWDVIEVSGVLTVPFSTPLQIAPASGDKVCLIGELVNISTSAAISINASGFYGN